MLELKTKIAGVGRLKLSIVIPGHNESRTIAQVLDGLLRLDLPNLQKEIIVVDDGSSDETAAVARSAVSSPAVSLSNPPNPSKERAACETIIVVTHLLNRGLGGALGTGIEAALRRNADLIVTFDADGQHAPADIPKVIGPILANQADAVIGSRMLGGDGMPWHRRIANHLANLFTWILFGFRTTDSQSGLRAFSRFAAERIRIASNNYEVSSEICGEIGRQHLRLTEVPIRPIYTDYSLSKGQGFLTGIRTLLRMLLHLTER